MKTLRYRKIADTIEHQIDHSLIAIGQRLPSIRKMAELQDVSPSTVVQAYAVLEQEGYAQAQPQSGYYAQLPQQSLNTPPASYSQQPLQLALSADILDILSGIKEPGAIKFGAALPDPDFLPLKTLHQATRQAYSQGYRDNQQQLFSPGLEELRRGLALRMSNMGTDCHWGDIVITAGCQDAVILALQSCTEAGDIVAVESPCYHGFLLALENLGLTPLPIATSPQSGLNIPALEKAAQRWPIKALICSPRCQNPTGAVLPTADRKQLLALSQSYQFTIIEDDILGDLQHHLTAETRQPLKAIDTEQRVIYCSSLSKTVSPGLRIGWIVPGAYTDRARERQTAGALSVPTITQKIAAHYLAKGTLDKHLHSVRNNYRNNLLRARSLITEHFPKGTTATQPGGGYVLWVGLPDTLDSGELFHLAQKNGIAIAPGKIFGGVAFNSFFRINCGLNWQHKHDLAIEKLGRLTATLH